MNVEYFLHPSTSSNLRFLFLPFPPKEDLSAHPAFSVGMPQANREQGEFPEDVSRQKLKDAIHDYCGSMCPVYEDPHLSHLEVEFKWVNKPNANGTIGTVACLMAKVFVSPYWKVITRESDRPSAVLIRMHGGEIPLSGPLDRFRKGEKAFHGYTFTYFPDDVVLGPTTWVNTSMLHSFRYVKGSYLAAKRRQKGQAAATERRWLRSPVLPCRDVSDFSRAILSYAGFEKTYLVICPRSHKPGLRCLKNIIAFGELLNKGLSKRDKREFAKRVYDSLGKKALFIIGHHASKKLTSTTNKNEHEMISTCRRILRLAGR